MPYLRDIYKSGQQPHIVFRMERKPYLYPVWGMPTDSIHDYREQLEQVSLMLSLSKDLAAAYYLLNQLYAVMGSKDVHEAKKRLSDWFMAVNAADIEEFTECAQTYADWMAEILNIFRMGLSNGYTQECNNRIKVIKRNAYGMRNFERFRKRILHCMSS